MFTGIVEAIGQIEAIERLPEGGRLRVRAGAVLEGARAGESIAVAGVCLTMVEVVDGAFAADLAAETLRRTTLGRLHPGDAVNLERPLRLADRLGGHVVQGHADGVGTITQVRPEGDGVWMEIEAPAALAPYIVEKGSIAVDGVSLTVAGLPGGSRFAVALIPHTLAVTTLGQRRPHDEVNLEVDILAKYVERLLEGGRAR
ncbi:MAG: riboflavin synthase [Armatimonadota bacterium]|nr:riboflavin synthase [Armatimonadota bacterium]MDR7453212.1 riboflavin synthase [Armatimonadota bacterium]MDR7455827.1 riboflavin synthase [Armatimonadota bacterium]MDR7512357.1 riboflavin synthase [Armatimonadota bacterium]